MFAIMTSVGELSNIFTVLAVLICFCALLVLITRNMLVVRFNGEEMLFTPTPLHQDIHGAQRIPQMNMIRVRIPFTFKLHEALSSSYEEVQCSVSSQVPYRMRVFWGVNIRELHICLRSPWSVFRKACHSPAFLKDFYKYQGPSTMEVSHAEKRVKFCLGDPPELGALPRVYYPLVVFLVRTDDDQRDLHPDEAVALISVVHIRDSVCPLPTIMLAQYLKQANGQFSCLKQLYLATGSSPNESYEDDHDLGLSMAEPLAAGGRSALVCHQSEEALKNNKNEQLCVVCLYFPLSRALLPCRHTCICASCFSRIERCPMCREPIKSYFCIRGEDYMPLRSNKTAKEPHMGPLCAWLDSWNDRLTDFLGFQR